MTNKEVMLLQNNMQILKNLKGFNLAKAIIINMKKINEELIDVIKTMIEGKEEAEANAIIEEVLSKESTITFVTLDDEDIPGDVTVEQYAVLSNFLK